MENTTVWANDQNKRSKQLVLKNSQDPPIIPYRSKIVLLNVLGEERAVHLQEIFEKKINVKIDSK